MTFQQIIDLAKSRSTPSRTVAVYPETKNPTYHRNIGLPLEDKLIKLINDTGWNSKTAPIFVQSFEPGSLKEMRGKGLNTRVIQLINADDYDLKTGKLTYTFRNEQRRLAFDYNKDPKAEYLQFYRLGIDGLFSDFADTALEARKTYLQELGR